MVFWGYQMRYLRLWVQKKEPNFLLSLVMLKEFFYFISWLVDRISQFPPFMVSVAKCYLNCLHWWASENLVGRGGYAEVYRGVMKDGQVIAVKRLMRASNEQKEKEFLTELGTIGHVHHPNVSSLLGCCVDNGLHLIFEFSLRGSVASLLHGNRINLKFFLDSYNSIELTHSLCSAFSVIFIDENLPPMAWKIRYKIVIGTARGLHYLHKGCQRRIIHRDIKTSNVLLTADFEPQVSKALLISWLLFCLNSCLFWN